MAAVDCIRALTHDLQSQGDNSATIERVRRDVVQVALTSLATSVVSRLTDLRGELHDELSSREASRTDKKLRGLQADLARLFDEAERQAYELLTRALET